MTIARTAAGTPNADISPINQGRAVRAQCRDGRLTGPTAGLAPGLVQGNLAILPKALAEHFLRFCLANPKPCPLIGVSEPGHTDIPALGPDIDIRTDLPGYRIWRHGTLVAETTDVRDVWRDDLVSFVIGCSFSFEEPMLAEGLPIRHIEQGVNVPMYRTSIACTPAGPFHGPMVVSMRPLKPTAAIRAVQITSRYPAVHGAPVHIGLPEQIGIADINRPDYGDQVIINQDELPVFWACGVTPQAAIATAKPEFAITHQPGKMLVTDVKSSTYAVF